MHALAGIVLVVWVLAFLRTLCNLILLPRLRANARPQREPFLSVVVPARNESHVIGPTVRAFLTQDYPNIEVVVVNDRSTDGTGEILRAFDDPRLIVIDGEETPVGWLGKPWALEQGARRAKGELILFADADILYEPAAIRAAVAEILASDAALIAMLPRFEMHGLGEHVGMAMLPFALVMFPIWLGNRWQRPALAVGGGSGNLVRREWLETIGFFGTLRDAVIDDIGLAREVRRSGGKTLGVRAESLVRVRMYHGARAIVEGFTKNLFVAMGRSYLASAILLLLLVVLHLMPYAMALTGDHFAIATVILISVTRAVLFAATGHSLWNAILLHPLMVSFWAYIFLRSVWVTGIRKQVRWRGRVYDAAQTRFGGR